MCLERARGFSITLYVRFNVKAIYHVRGVQSTQGFNIDQKILVMVLTGGTGAAGPASAILHSSPEGGIRIMDSCCPGMKHHASNT